MHQRLEKKNRAMLQSKSKQKDEISTSKKINRLVPIWHSKDAALHTMKPKTHLVELNNVGVVQHFHDLNFSVDLLQVDGIQLGLVDDLNGHLQNQASTTQL